MNKTAVAPAPSTKHMTDSADHALPDSGRTSAALKTEIRARIRAGLGEMGPEARHDASLAACQRLISLDVFRNASVVMLYMPLETEVDLTPAAIRCFQTGKTVCVPRVDWKRRDMHPVEVTSFDDHFMEADEHGIRTPREVRPVVPAAIDAVIVPGLAFDARGNRLGRGGGFYDRFLARLPRLTRTIGLAYDFQIIDEVPVDANDFSLDLVVTDRRVTRSRSRSRK